VRASSDRYTPRNTAARLARSSLDLQIIVEQINFAMPISGTLADLRVTFSSAAVCSIVNNLVTKAKAQTQATSFCSSFLHIPTVTTTITQINAPYAYSLARSFTPGHG
jgi:hypothetical protein